MCAQANTGTVLDRILESRRAEVEHRKKVLPETALKYGVQAASPLRDFAGALSRPGINIMAELKPASPSRGVLRNPFDAVALAQSLEVARAAGSGQGTWNGTDRGGPYAPGVGPGACGGSANYRRE